MLDTVQTLQVPLIRRDILTQVKRPVCVSETGLGERLLLELLAKHLYHGGELDLHQLSRRSALSGPIIEQLLGFLRKEAFMEVLGARMGSQSLRYALTERGRVFALEAIEKGAYLGPAPVPLEHFTRLVQAQSVHSIEVTREAMHRSYSDLILDPEILDSLGAAMHSGRAMFIYGRPGSGKTYTAQRLSRLLGGPIFLPHAIAVGEETVQLYDPIVHRAVGDGETNTGVLLQEGYDARFCLCERPEVIVGGELTLDMLEVSRNRLGNLMEAPLQLKAANGIFVIDDLGRQRVSTVDLFNRWIVPLETRVDHLTLSSGRRFPTPFDVILIFSTNLNPGDLADEAFLRRIGHKIGFGALQRREYIAIWKQVCGANGVECPDEVLAYVIEELHEKGNMPLLACHPRDLLGITLDYDRYNGGDKRLTTQALHAAWRRYFVQVAQA